MACCGVPQSGALEELCAETSLLPEEVKALADRFKKVAPAGFMDEEKFVNALGIVGIAGSDSYIAGRIFRVFDSDKNNRVELNEFVRALAVLLRGTEQEKLRFSFQLADSRGVGRINFADFAALVHGC